MSQQDFEQGVNHVSDTARWVAAYRAWESARPDALFTDPFAERLAGTHGQSIARGFAKDADGNGWPIIARTKLIDEMVLAQVTAGVRLVVNLAAGFDTRPYRLNLPQDLRWVEVDVPSILEEKERLLSGEEARCRVERRALDLASAEQRQSLLRELLDTEERVLVIAEGLLIYLDEAAVTELVCEIREHASVQSWIFDLCSPAVLKLLRRGKPDSLSRLFQFAPENGLGFFEAHGFAGVEVHSLFHEAVRLKRVPFLLRFFALFPPANPRNPGRQNWAAVVRLAPCAQAFSPVVLEKPPAFFLRTSSSSPIERHTCWRETSTSLLGFPLSSAPRGPAMRVGATTASHLTELRQNGGTAPLGIGTSGRSSPDQKVGVEGSLESHARSLLGTALHVHDGKL